MAIVFLCGGTGNQLFQYAASHPGDRFSTLFLRGPLARLLGWTEHTQLLQFPAPSKLREGAALALLLLDAVLARLLGCSLFSRFDLRAVKAEPRCARWQQFGYFHTVRATRDVAELAPQLLERGEASPVDIALHIRGGDVRRLQAAGRNPYGLLPPEYFAAALAQRGGAGRYLTVFTDDRAHAANLLHLAAPGSAASIDDGPLEQMLAGCLSARLFIACNSTLSWWIVRLRGSARPSVVPEPFARDLALANPDYAHGIPVKY